MFTTFNQNSLNNNFGNKPSFIELEPDFLKKIRLNLLTYLTKEREKENNNKLFQTRKGHFIV